MLSATLPTALPAALGALGSGTLSRRGNCHRPGGFSLKTAAAGVGASFSHSLPLPGLIPRLLFFFLTDTREEQKERFTLNYPGWVLQLEPRGTGAC